MKTLPDLFATPIKAVNVRKNIVAYKYQNGVINIAGEKYVGYSMTDAIKLWRRKFPKRQEKKY